jgi:heat-inducible transcriptional repressor
MEGIGQGITDRARRLLTALAELYIETGEPVSSVALSKEMEKSGERMPPSSVRLELGKLEQGGYLTKPHTSGGRIPTVKAYRVYVEIIDPSRMTPRLPREIQEACNALAGELGRLLDYAGEVLARESGCLGFVTSPSLADARIAGFKLDPVEEDVLLLRLELSSGSSYHNLARIPRAVGSFRLDALAEMLSDRFKGRRLGDVGEGEIAELVDQAARWGKGYDIFVHPLHNLITDARLGEGPRTVLHGAAGLLKASGDDAEALARAVEFLDNRRSLERTLGAVPKPEEVKVVIGGDGASADEKILDGFALVVASYHLHARARGRLGILGPLRMPYARHLALVRGVSETVSRVLISRELTPRFG